VVEPVDPLQGGDLDVVGGAPWPSRFDQPGLVEAADGLARALSSLTPAVMINQAGQVGSGAEKDVPVVICETDLTKLLVAIATSDHAAAADLLNSAPSLATTAVLRGDEFFLAKRFIQVYEGDTALHAAAFSYDPDIARDLITRGSDIRARNRRGAEPLHAATIGNPDSATWDPTRQREVIGLLITAGADPNATAADGVTPLHRAVRNRCSAAVAALLRGGAYPHLPNAGGSTAAQLARWTTGRGGSGSACAKAEQRIIIELLNTDTA
jgi:hypothetical protein